MRYPYLAMIGCIATLFSTSALAADQASVSYVTGGVGKTSQEAIAAAEKDHSLKLLLTEKSGAYLSDVLITVLDKQNKEVASFVTRGPVALIDLPKGSYQITASIQDQTQKARIQITGKKLHNHHFRFDLPEEEQAVPQNGVRIDL